MRILVAVEDWGPAHAGPSGVAWWLAHGLASRGHRVQVIAAHSRGGQRGSVSVRTLAATWPTGRALVLANERAPEASRALASIQREILSSMGAITDTSAVDLRGVDAVLAIGIRSPHVRRLAERARGRAVVIYQLQEGDRAISSMPVVQLLLRHQPLMAHSEGASSALTGDLGPIEVVLPGVHPPTPPWEPRPPWTSSRPAGTNPGAVVLVDVATPVDAHWEVAARRAGRTVHRVHSPELTAGRMDRVLLAAGAVVIGAGDAGDVPNLAMRYRVPLVVDPKSSGAVDVAASGGGWVADVESPIGAVLEAALGQEGALRALNGEAFVVSQRSWDALSVPYERAVNTSGSLSRGKMAPSAAAQ